MKWRKLGRIFVPDSSIPWGQTHAYVPTVMLRGDEFRIYVSFWDNQQVKRIGFIDVPAEDPTRILLRISQTPVLDIGEPGTFDSDGVTPSFILNQGKEVWLYYTGWQSLAGLLPRYIFAGLAISTDGGDTFKRYKQTPILERSETGRFIRSTLSILKEGRLYRCWYTSSNKIIDIHGYLVPSYTIYHTVSTDGIKWGNGVSSILLAAPDEFGLSRPWVIKENNIYKVFYSIRRIDKGYSLGYAESNCGYHWRRKDNKVKIKKSKEGWDSEMICFPSIVDYEGKRYMFYNGNNCGKTGVGVAILEED